MAMVEPLEPVERLNEFRSRSLISPLNDVGRKMKFLTTRYAGDTEARRKKTESATTDEHG